MFKIGILGFRFFLFGAIVVLGKAPSIPKYFSQYDDRAVRCNLFIALAFAPFYKKDFHYHRLSEVLAKNDYIWYMETLQEFRRANEQDSEQIWDKMLNTFTTLIAN